MPRGVLGARERELDDEPQASGLHRCSPSAVPQLAAEARAASERVREAERDHAHRLALLARAASAAGGDGAGTLESSAATARVSRQTLQEFVTLTTRWEPAQIAALVGEEDRCGRAITRTMLLKLARGPRAVRVAFAEAVARGDLDLAAQFPDLLETRRSSRKIRAIEGTRGNDGEGKSQ